MNPSDVLSETVRAASRDCSTKTAKSAMQLIPAPAAELITMILSQGGLGWWRRAASSNVAGPPETESAAWRDAATARVGSERFFLDLPRALR